MTFAFSALRVARAACWACAALPELAGPSPAAATCTTSACVTVGMAAADTAGGLAPTAAACAGWCTPEELDAAPDSWTVVLFSAYFSSMALMALRRAPSTSTCLRAPVATAKPVPRTASVVLGVTTLKSLDRPTLSTLKSARPCLTAAVVRSTSPSCTACGSWNMVPASSSTVALRMRSAACDRSPVRISTPASTESLTLASRHWSLSPARHCTLPATSMKTARIGSCAAGAAAFACCVASAPDWPRAAGAASPSSVAASPTLASTVVRAAERRNAGPWKLMSPMWFRRTPSARRSASPSIDGPISRAQGKHRQAGRRLHSPRNSP